MVNGAKEKQKSNPCDYRSIVDEALHCQFKNVEAEYTNTSNKNELMECLEKLSITDRRLLILYAELSSLRKVAKIYNCSEATIRNRLMEVKKQFAHLKNKRYDFIESDSDNSYSRFCY